MTIERHIVNRVAKTSEHRPAGLRDSDVEIIDARFWPSSEFAFEQQDETVAVEVSMLPPTRRLLRDFPVPGLEQPYLRHLEQRIARNPRDLLSHVRRLYLASALGNAEQIAGALTDLYLVLGESGRRLRRRMLRLVAPQLAADHRQFFETHVERGLVENDVIIEMPESRLSKHLSGTTTIVFRADEAANSEDPVVLARDSLSRGHDDVAQAVLEGALESDPGNRAVSEALLELYNDKGLRSDFKKTYTALLGRRLARRDRWDELAQRFQVRVGPHE